ncbi:glycine betaine ABC transporter substrate-binding protein [Sporolactobacillus sp. THM7-4]|nr:glycine betaine ABC transporter substrate-binding protein [Sporolactobacillus sp. THM7-4]
MTSSCPETNSGLAVPDYVDVKSLRDLNSHKSEFDGKIIGIEPGAGLMRLTRENAIPQYDLKNWTLVESSTGAMLAQLKKAVAVKKPIVVTLWRPHWAFQVYGLRYLDDPKRSMNPNGVEKLQVIGSKNFSGKHPEVAKWMKSFKLSSTQLAELETAINNSKDPVKGTKSWLSKNKKVTDEWFK